MNSGTIYTFKLSTGEEIVAKFTGWGSGVHDHEVHISKPLMIGVRPVPGQPDAYGLTFVPWLASVDVEEMLSDVTIQERHIIASFEAPKRIVDGYLRHTSSIQIATASSLLTEAK